MNCEIDIWDIPKLEKDLEFKYLLELKYNILISSAGRRVSLVRLFIKALKEQNINGLVHAIDIDSNVQIERNWLLGVQKAVI